MAGEDMGANQVNSEVSLPEGRSLKASFNRQTRAMFRKQWTFQWRNRGQNCCLLFTPIFFCIIMLVVQQIVNQLLSGSSFECGHKCTVCCNDAAKTDCFNVTGDAYCDTTYQYCKERDPNVYGIAYSDPGQAGYCPVEYPAAWPVVYHVPQASYRASPDRPAIDILYTGSNTTLAQSYMANMIPAFAGASTMSSPNGQDLSTAMTTSAITAVAANGTTVYTLAEGIASAVIAKPSLAPFLATVEQTPGSLTYQEDAAWTGLSMKDAVGVVTSDCSALVAWAETQVNTTTWNGWNNQTGTDQGETYWTKILSAKYLSCINAYPKELTSASAVDATLFCGYRQASGSCGRGHPEAEEYPAAFDWRDSGPSRAAFRVWLNTTVDGKNNGAPVVPFRVLKPFDLALQSWLKTHLGPEYSASTLYMKETPKGATKLRLDFSSLLGPLFFLWVLGLPFPVMMQSMVYEKENRLRIMMKMHGLSDTTYWVVSYMWWIMITFIYSLFLLIFGNAINLNFFRGNDFSVELIFVITAQHAQVATAFLLSSVFKSSRTATIFGYIWILGSGIFAANIMSTFIDEARKWVPAIELIPTFGIYRGLYEMSQYAFRGQYRGGKGLTWSSLSDPNNGMGRVMGVFMLEYFVAMPLAWYLEQVVDDSSGVRRHWLFFLQRKRKDGFEKDTATPTVAARELLGGDDVMTERDLALNLNQEDASEYPIIIKDLHKVFPGQDGNPPKMAVKSLSMAVRREEVLGLLGPNGAGKTTSIHMMVGFLEPSGGTAIVDGMSIREDMDTIYTIMGVCPQHDILWHRLTGREHLNFYGHLKNIPYDRLKDEVDAALKAVNLLNVGNKPCGQYSGGMKRRLSVAISIIGNPRVVYMDEPSTGLDPASRRSLWDVVKAAKENKAVILTTHSMQEAEVLCDRLGIFVDGELYTIGNPRDITARYGGYLIFSISTPEEQVERAAALAKSIHRSAELKYHVGGTQKFKLPANEVNLSSVFKAVEDAQSRGLQVVDWAVQNASLEDVFIEIARSANAQSQDLKA